MILVTIGFLVWPSSPILAATAMPTSYTVRLRHLSDVKPFVLIPNHSDRAVDDLSRCIVSAFPAIVARSQERPDKIKVPGVVAANGKPCFGEGGF